MFFIESHLSKLECDLHEMESKYNSMVIDPKYIEDSIIKLKADIDKSIIHSLQIFINKNYAIVYLTNAQLYFN